MDIKTIGSAVRQQRKLKGLTQEELARQAGLSVMSVRRYESGDRIASESVLRRIAGALDLPDAFFLRPASEDWDADDVYRAIAHMEKQVSLARERKASTEEIAEWENVCDLLHKMEFGIPDAMTIPESENVRTLLDAYETLNDRGQTVAIERIKELAEIPMYAAQKNPAEYEIIGNRIKQAREKHGLSHHALAEMCHISAEELPQIELGIKRIPPEALKYLSSSLDIPMSKLVPLTPEEQAEADRCSNALQDIEDWEQEAIKTDSIKPEVSAAFKLQRDRISGKLGEILGTAIERMQEQERKRSGGMC